MIKINSLRLKEEESGGILFDPNSGTFVEVDHEGFNFLSDYSLKFESPHDQKQRQLRENFLAEIKREVDLRLPIQVFKKKGMNSFPTLIDLMITRNCDQGCPHCYASATTKGLHTSTEDILRIIDEASAHGTLEMAIGGGEPTLHPDFCEIIKYSHQKGVVPSITTGGDNLTPKVLRALKKYVGAVGLSLEGLETDFDQRRKIGFRRFQNAIELLKAHEIPVVLQITLSANNFLKLDSLVNFCLSVKGLYGFLFLAFKSTGRGVSYDRPLSSLKGVSVGAELSKAFTILSPHTRVGYDVCMTPAITQVGEIQFGKDYVDFEGCTALRSSVGITPELDVLPCTFWGNMKMGNLRKNTLFEVWNNARSIQFRENHEQLPSRNGFCLSCNYKTSCRGGCPVTHLVDCTNSTQTLLTAQRE